MKLPDGVLLPATMLHDWDNTTLLAPEIVHELSLIENEVPDTWTKVPGGPKIGVSVMVGPVVTMNVACAESPPGVADKVIT